MGFGRSSSGAHTHVGVLLAVAMLASCLAVATPTQPAAAASLPPGFQEEIVFSGLTQPTAVRFSPDGRVFVAEKSGVIKVFDNLTDTTPTVFADLRTQVHNFWDRGLLGLALPPNFPTDPWVYVLYTFDAAIGGTAPRWGSVGGTSDGCPTPPGATDDGCVVAGRLSRLQASGQRHDRLGAGADRGLVPAVPEPLDRQPGLRCRRRALRQRRGRRQLQLRRLRPGRRAAQPVRRSAGRRRRGADAAARRGRGAAQPGPRTTGDPTGLAGAILRVDPATGAGLPDNPMASSADANARRIVANGLRNPFRITTRPGTNEVWIGDVGWNEWEEINRLVSPAGVAGRQLRVALLRGRRSPGRL